MYNRLIIKIVPKHSDNLNYNINNNNNNINKNNNNNNTHENLNRIKSIECLNSMNSKRKNSAATSMYKSNNNLDNSNSSVNGSDREVVLFFGFEESWERDLWSSWLMEVIYLFIYLFI